MPTTQPEELYEEGCFATTFERKYYHRGGAFIKRSLRPREFRTNQRGNLHVPRINGERIKNEADTLRYIRQHTDIPVPTVYADFEDDEAYYLVVEYVKGISMAHLPDDQMAVGLRSDHIGGPSGIVIPPYRVMRQATKDDWDLRRSEKKEYVFCHNDLSQHNVIVDPNTLKITAIIDWEYAGFYPANFEMPFYRRDGPSVARKGEVDDSAALLAFLKGQDVSSVVVSQHKS
ncbi:kinase-like domain-containing protein [Chaetomium fimeti]|uniref:Kinase-like domain-containing protein n=1 Tax=Chaetomium fimeti TaxID=1854472 RepID=A0AAE0LPZ2_9PEZI|nr:kinase-like domain-containing protein [Chaetomium fimeti]